METLLDGIVFLFEEILFIPFNALRELEMDNWWLSNGLTWLFILILVAALFYWLKQLRIFDARGEEDESQTAHSFLG
jgi:hypothetical protein